MQNTETNQAWWRKIAIFGILAKLTLTRRQTTRNISMGMEQTLIILKPDAVKRALMGRIITRFEEKGLCVVAAKMMKITPELAAQHYSEHTEKDFYPGLVEFMTSCPVLSDGT